MIISCGNLPTAVPRTPQILYQQNIPFLSYLKFQIASSFEMTDVFFIVLMALISNAPVKFSYYLQFYGCFTAISVKAFRPLPLMMYTLLRDIFIFTFMATERRITQFKIEFKAKASNQDSIQNIYLKVFNHFAI